MENLTMYHTICGIAFGNPNKTFCQLSNLKTHIKSVHEGLKNHKCDLCDKKFGHSSVLKKHIKGIHEGLKDLKTL